MHPDLYALVLRLRPQPGNPPPNPQGHGAHALFLDLVHQVDPALAELLHADGPNKPFTVAVLPTPRHQRNSEGIVDLRVTLLRVDLFAPFTRALLQQTSTPAMRLGSVALALTDVFGTPGSHPWAGFSACAEVWDACVPAKLLALEFVTPTAFGQSTRSDGRSRLGLLPLPETVFSSIARRWNDLAPPALHLDPAAVTAAAAETVISRYHLESCQISLGKGPQKGFIGSCAYELPSDPAQARLLTLLADAVFYLGLGMKTARGMGLCRRVLDHGASDPQTQKQPRQERIASDSNVAIQQ